MDNKFSVIDSDKKKKDNPTTFRIVYEDGEVVEFKGDYMGHSDVYGPIILILNNNGDDTEPVAIINSDKMKRIEIKNDEH